MQKIVGWFFIMLKCQCKKKKTWVICVCVLLCLWFLQTMGQGQENTTRVALCDGAMDEASKELVKLLVEEDGLFQFYQVEDETEIKKDVKKGDALCGFVLEPGFQSKMEEGVQKACITYVCSTVTAMGKVAKEAVYAHFFQVYSRLLITQNIGELKPDNQEAFLEEVLKKREDYLNSDELFFVDVINEGYGIRESKKDTATYPVEGMLAVFILAGMLLMNGDNLSDERRQLLEIMPFWDSVCLRVIQYLVMGLIIALSGVVFFVLQGSTEGLIKRLAGLLGVVVISLVWTMVLQGILKKEQTYYIWVVTIVLMNVMVSPIFFDISSYIPFLYDVQNIFPAGFYLHLL